MESVKICPRCSSPEVSGKGFRKLKAGKIRVFKCKKCGRKFTPQPHDETQNNLIVAACINGSDSGQTP